MRHFPCEWIEAFHRDLGRVATFRQDPVTWPAVGFEVDDDVLHGAGVPFYLSTLSFVSDRRPILRHLAVCWEQPRRGFEQKWWEDAGARLGATRNATEAHHHGLSARGGPSQKKTINPSKTE